MPRRVDVSSSSSNSGSSISQASIGAGVGCDCVFSGGGERWGGLQMIFDRAIRSGHPVEKVDFFDGMCGSDCSIEKVGI